MLGYVYGHDEAVARFVAQMIPAMGGRDFPLSSKAIGIIEDGRLIAGVVWHGWNPEAGVIEMSGATLPGKRWISRETLKRIYQYPFLQCRCQMLMQQVAADDERLLSCLARLNYSFVPIPRLLGRDRDAVLCLLTREAWAANRICQKLNHHIDVQPLLEEAA